MTGAGGSRPGFRQIHSMFRQRVQALVMRDKSAIRDLWRSFGDHRDLNVISAAQFYEAINRVLKVQLPQADCDRLLKAFSGTGSHQINYRDFVHKLCGLPESFAEPLIDTKHKTKKHSSGNIFNQELPLLPASTTVEQLDARFRLKCRRALFDVGQALARVLRRPGRGQMLDRDHLFNVVADCDVHLQRHELDCLFDAFDHNSDGFLEYNEFVRELLQMSRPKRTSKTEPRDTAVRAKHPIVMLLRRNCERAAASPARILEFFQRYDLDGSGNIAYDEMRLMVRDFNCQMEKKDSASLLLDLYAGGKGSMGYMDFIDRVLRMPRSALRKIEDRPATAEMVAQIVDGAKRRILAHPKAQKLAYETFRRTCDLRQPTFNERLLELGLPVTRRDSRKLFQHYNTDKSGSLSQSQFVQTFVSPPVSRGVAGVPHTPLPSKRRGVLKALPPTHSQLSARERLNTHRNTF